MYKAKGLGKNRFTRFDEKIKFSIDTILAYAIIIPIWGIFDNDPIKYNIIVMEVIVMKEITDNMFKTEVLESNIPVVVDFWATWCGPCKMVAPVMEELDTQYNGKAKFVKVDVDQNPAVSGEYGILSIPTIMLFKDGKVAETIVGFRPKADFENIISKHI